MKRILFSLTIFALTALLGGCGFNLFNVPSIEFSIIGGSLGYAVDQNGVITIGERVLTFRNRAGALGATITGYRLEFFDGAGNSIQGTDNFTEGSMNIFVPPGIQCDTPDPLLGCTTNSKGAYFSDGPVVQTQGYQLLPVGVAIAHLNAWTTASAPIGWYGDIRFTGVSSTGAGFTTRAYRLAMAPPN